MSDPHPPAQPSLLSRLVRFGGVSALSMLINVGGSWLLYDRFGWSPEAAYALSLVVVFAVNFTLFRFWVFKSHGSHAGRQLAAYLTSAVAFRVGEYLAFLGLHTGLDLPPLPSILAISVVATALKFLVFNGRVFKARPAEGG